MRQITRVLVICGLALSTCKARPPEKNISHVAGEEPDDTWSFNSVISGARRTTDLSLGAAQGASVIDGMLYIYGDLENSQPHTGIIKEFDLSARPTGRKIMLTRFGQPMSAHPSGLSKHPTYGVALGDTVNGRATIFVLDWKQALQDGNLDRAIRKQINDDAAIRGTRPVFINFGGRDLVATADYGDVNTHIRLYDTGALMQSDRTTAPGVMVANIISSPFNQNLFWDTQRQQLIAVQNVTPGRGWRLEHINLASALAANNATTPGTVTEVNIYPPHDELEEWTMLPNGEEMFITSSLSNNITIGKTVRGPDRSTPEGEMRVEM